MTESQLTRPKSLIPIFRHPVEREALTKKHFYGLKPQEGRGRFPPKSNVPVFFLLLLSPPFMFFPPFMIYAKIGISLLVAAHIVSCSSNSFGGHDSNHNSHCNSSCNSCCNSCNSHHKSHCNSCPNSHHNSGSSGGSSSDSSGGDNIVTL